MDGAGPDDLPTETRRALEAIVMVAAEPVPPQMLAQLLEVSVDRVEAACTALAAGYEADHRGFVLVRVAGGYRFQSHPAAAPYVERYVLEGQSARLSNAALETLAIVAYKQPLSRAQIASIRGVNVDGVMRTLTHRGLVAEVARDPGPGQAVLYGTTTLFLERLGVDSLDELAPIAGFVPGADVVEALEHGLRFDGSPAASTDDDDEVAGTPRPPTPPAADDPPPGIDGDDPGPEDVGPSAIDPDEIGPDDAGVAAIDPDDADEPRNLTDRGPRAPGGEADGGGDGAR
jgi:segregation and condensation protein B